MDENILLVIKEKETPKKVEVLEKRVTFSETNQIKIIERIPHQSQQAQPVKPRFIPPRRKMGMMFL